MTMMTSHSHEQRGAALLLILLLLVVAGSTLALGALNTNPALQAQRQRDLHQQMLRAKEALLAYAAYSATLHANTRGPGFFPCPDTSTSDTDNDGIVSDDEVTDCAGYAAAIPLIGRLPLAVDAAGGRYELIAHNIGIDQQFWYAVGNRYVAISATTAPASVLRNSVRRTSATLAEATDYRLWLDGTPGYVALIIAPGEALATQDRVSAPDSHSNYLDQGNGEGFSFISRYPADPATLNDQILGITLDEYLRAVGMPTMLAIKQELDVYYINNGNQYPASAGYSNFPQAPSASGTQDEFQAVFHDMLAADHVWLRGDAGPPAMQGNGENWPVFTYYLQVSSTQAQMAFAGCPGMIYTVNYAGDITRSGGSC